MIYLCNEIERTENEGDQLWFASGSYYAISIGRIKKRQQVALQLIWKRHEAETEAATRKISIHW